MKDNSSIARLAVDPVHAVSAVLHRLVSQHGYNEVAIGEDLLEPDDDGDYRLDIELALSPDGLLPLIVERAATTYRRANLDTRDQFPLHILDDSDALLGTKVVWRGEVRPALFDIALACAGDALLQIMEKNPSSQGVLTLGATQG